MVGIVGVIGTVGVVPVGVVGVLDEDANRQLPRPGWDHQHDQELSFPL